MLVHFSHSNHYNYGKYFYPKVEESELTTTHTLSFSNEDIYSPYEIRKLIAECDILIADISYFSIGLSMEIGYAKRNQKPIFYVYKDKTTGPIFVKTEGAAEYAYDTFDELVYVLNAHFKNRKEEV